MSDKRGRNKISARIVRPGGKAEKRPSPDHMADAVFEKPLRHSAYSAESHRFFLRVAPTVAFGVVLYVLLQNLGEVTGWFNNVMRALAPVLVGVLLAFVLNIPLRLFEGHVLCWIKQKSVRRGLSVALCYILLLAFVLTLIFVVLPQLTVALQSLSSMLPMLGKELYDAAAKLVEKYDLDEEILTHLQFDWNSIAMTVIEWVTSSLPQLMSTTRDITSSVFEIFLGFIMSIYMLFSKERMAAHWRRLCQAVLPRDWAERVINVCSLAQTTFRGYMTGMLTEACILCTLTATGMAIIGFPSPIFAGVLMGIGALIPIFGIFIMVTVNAILIAVQADIFTGLWFVVYITLLQQFEGNVIYPRVMGNAIRLPSLWVLAAATVGGTLFGLAGLLLSIPVVSIIYSLVRAFVLTRERAAGKTAAKGD